MHVITFLVFVFYPMLNKLRLAKSCLLHNVQYCFVYEISSCYKIKSWTWKLFYLLLYIHVWLHLRMNYFHSLTGLDSDIHIAQDLFDYKQNINIGINS